MTTTYFFTFYDAEKPDEKAAERQTSVCDKYQHHTGDLPREATQGDDTTTTLNTAETMDAFLSYMQWLQQFFPLSS